MHIENLAKMMTPHARCKFDFRLAARGCCSTTCGRYESTQMLFYCLMKIPQHLKIDDALSMISVHTNFKHEYTLKLCEHFHIPSSLLLIHKTVQY